MSTAARAVALTETAKHDQKLAVANDLKRTGAAANNYSARRDEQRRKWGVETRAVRSVHARKF